MTQLHIATPTVFSDALSRHLGTKVYLKLEALQPSGSFKNRGIGSFCRQKAENGAETFVCSSGGNAGLAAAYAARVLGIPITVVLPESTPILMKERIQREGASVIQYGIDWQAADAHARMLCEGLNACYVPPFDDPLIWEGNASLIHEVHESGLRPGAVVLSVGGGGLFCGVAQGMHSVGWSDVPIYAVETQGAASFAAAIDARQVVELPCIDTIAKSLGARAVAEQALEWTKTRPVVSKVVSDASALNACGQFAQDHRLLVEPACGASLSLCYRRDSDLSRHSNVLVVVCGGAAIEPSLLVNT